jgi:signal-transduction protein with cAMP-binding, CBS, and nucleotidyltransferase domain
MNPAAQCFNNQAEKMANILAVKAVSQQGSEPEAEHTRRGEVMQTLTNTIDAKASVMAAVDQMWFSGADFLLVTEGDRCIGMITDRDLIVGCVCHHRRPTRTSVRDIMSAPAPTA